MIDLVGVWFQLYGVCDNIVKLGDANGNVIYLEAVEDPIDGYRSCLTELRIVHNPEGIFPSQAVAHVTVFGGDSMFGGVGRIILPPDHVLDTIKFVDHRNNVWLTLGTDNTDDYYPCFVFSWTPPTASPNDYAKVKAASTGQLIKKITSIISDFEEV